VLRLEGSVNGRRVARNCDTADSVTTVAAVLLDACAINELRRMRILKSLHLAALDGRTWGWSAMEFELSLHGQQDDVGCLDTQTRTPLGKTRVCLPRDDSSSPAL